jgi:glycosyltransferase involved in cell wall biosynthesis
MTPPAVDITFLLEGTYPYVRGGVSLWVHQLIEALPEFTFGLIFLGARREDLGEIGYPVPKNVKDIKTYFLMDSESPGAPEEVPGDGRYFADARELHRWFRNPGSECDHRLLKSVLMGFGNSSGCSRKEFFFSRSAWRAICDSFNTFYPEASFNEFFWATRSIHAPLFNLTGIVESAVPSRLFHTISTGYAGYLGALLHLHTGKPLMLTEHGIYTKERKIDLENLYLPAEGDSFEPESKKGGEVGKELWTRFFESLGRITYTCADPIITLYEKNRSRQIGDGAPPDRTLVIPNGIDVARFLPARNRRPDVIPPVLGLLGRIVPIKDIKTFIRAMRIVVSRMPEAQGWLIGPTEEDPGYVEECKALVKSLGLEESVHFLGFRKTEDILPKLGLMVLTSISEAFPLVIVEAFASGLPVISSDVGACRELIEGRSGKDRDLGSAGRVFPICNPEAVAGAALELMSRPDLWHSAQQAGIKRVETYYVQEEVIAKYRELYLEKMA